MIETSKKNRPRDVFDSDVSIRFLRNNRQLLGMIYAQKDRLALRNILPSNALSAFARDSQTKIKIRVFYLVFWNTLRTTCEACLNDRDIDLLMIASTEQEKDLLIRQGYNCLTQDEYDLKSDKPDVFVLSYCGGGEAHRSLGDIRKYSRLVVVTNQSMVLYGGLNGFIRLVEKYFAPYSPDFYMFDSLLYRKLKNTEYFRDKPLLEMGQAKYDGIYDACRTVKTVRGWEKLNGKTVILWTTSHGIYEGSGIIEHVSFDVYAKEVFQYMNDHQNLGLIFRPHSSLIGELIPKYALWTNEDLDILRRYCEASPNVVFDESKEYDNAFAISDAVISDPHCGVMISALPMLKPICVFYRSPSVKDYDDDTVRHFYKVHTREELLDFFAMIERGDDPMCSEREKTAREYVKHFDGKNGWRIKEFMKQAFQSKIMT